MVSKFSQPHPCVFSGDGRCDSPGHNAKYLTYTFLEHSINKIVAMSVTQFTECANSNRMEKYGFQKVLHGMEARDINIKQITTDRHAQIKKLMREEHPNISHQFDIWHVCKNIRKTLSKAAKKKSTSSFKKWIKSICNYFWWSCATCRGCEHTLGEKWTSILFHTQNKHNWLGYRFFHNCAHMELSKKNQRDKGCLDPNSDSFKALQTAVLDKTLINDLKHLTSFSILEAWKFIIPC